MIKWIKKNWTDPFWSSIFAGIILAAVGGLISLLISFVKQIPLADLYDKIITNYIQVSYLTIIIFLIALLSLILSIILISISRFRLKHSKIPPTLKTKQFNLQYFLKGKWVLTYSHNSELILNGQESVRFVHGNQYFVDNDLIFVLTDIDFNENRKELKWTKTRYNTNQKHARETLKIIDDKTISGTDDLNCIINYKKIC